MTRTTELPFGTALALAQRALTAPLVAVLATEDMTMPGWFTLNALGLRGPIPVGNLAGLLATNGLDAAAVQALLGVLGEQGLVEVQDDTVSLTDAGTARYTALRDRIQAAGARVFDRFDADRVEAARSLLQDIASTDPDLFAGDAAPAA